jgi:hypothetical protein
MTTETTMRARTAAATFGSRDEAERAVDRLRAAGFSQEQIGWAMRGSDTPDGANDVAKGATAGAVTGAGLGAAGAAVAMALIPGVGPFLAGGYLGTVLTAAGVSAAAGGLLGGAAGLGFDEDETRHYEDALKDGRAVVTVEAGERYTEAANILRDSGGSTYGVRGTGGRLS